MDVGARGRIIRTRVMGSLGILLRMGIPLKSEQESDWCYDD